MNAMKKIFEDLAQEMSEALVEDRHLEYPDGTIGITSLLYCPRKVDLRKKYPEIKSYGLEIDDGFLFEGQVKDALQRKWPTSTVDEFVTTYNSKNGGPNIQGHVDVVVKGKNKLLGIECKHTKILEHNLPYGSIDRKTVMIDDPDLVRRICISDTYVEQAAIQKYLLSKQQNKPVDHFLFIKTMMKIPGLGYKKIFILRETTEKYSEEKLERKIHQFCSDPHPRYSWECPFCAYLDAGLCKGVDIDSSPRKYGTKDLPKETIEALDRYESLYEQMVQVDEYLKKALQGKNIEISGKSGRNRQLGWVEYTNYGWNLKKAFDLIGSDLLQYLQVNWWKGKDLENVLAEVVPLSEIRSTERKPKWKGFIS